MTDPQNETGFIPPHGGYENLKSYQMSVLVYDATVKFCDRFIDPKSRTMIRWFRRRGAGTKT